MEMGAKVAVIQCNPQIGVEHISQNVQSSLKWAEQAVTNGANLVVFPELATTGYVFHDRKEAFAHAQPAQGGEIVSTWEDFCRQKNIYLSGSLVERDGENLYNTAVLIGPNGYIGKYRKTHLWDRDKLFFTPGNLGFPVFETELGRIGMLICWDVWFPETFRILAVQGADLICTLNNWVYTPGPLFDEIGRCMPVYHSMSAAQANGVYIAAANRVGTERDAKFLGNSVIVGPNGWPIEIADSEQETMLSAEIDLANSRRKHWTSLNDILTDRRKDLYDELVGYRQGQAAPR
ncbi:nitrilase family protein [Brevibacillus massiliensis]|uniref:nitrilase family protein n=1 Tax=Brevibacillus massiliensis TaxID=1118054 RepID=UPI0002F67EC2|nr:nitrilase family protein [Brevibacillus massiliensis]